MGPGKGRKEAELKSRSPVLTQSPPFPVNGNGGVEVKVNGRRESTGVLAIGTGAMTLVSDGTADGASRGTDGVKGATVQQTPKGKSEEEKRGEKKKEFLSTRDKRRAKGKEKSSVKDKKRGNWGKGSSVKDREQSDGDTTDDEQDVKSTGRWKRGREINLKKGRNSKRVKFQTVSVLIHNLKEIARQRAREETTSSSLSTTSSTTSSSTTSASSADSPPAFTRRAEGATVAAAWFNPTSEALVGVGEGGGEEE